MQILSLVSPRWQFREAGTARWYSAVVPGCIHRDLLRHGLIPDPFVGENEQAVQWVDERDWEYRAHLHLEAADLAHEHVDLAADGLDTLATIRLNGRELGRTENMFTGRRFQAKALLRPGDNELLIRFASATRYVRTHRRDHQPREIMDPVGGCTRLRKQQCQFGWDWAPRLVTAGIWRDLRLELWNTNRLTGVRITQRHSSDGSVILAFMPELARPDAPASIAGTVSIAGRVVAEIKNNKSKIKEPKRWWPNGQGGQPLYEIEVELKEGATVLDRWRRRIGLRTVQLRRRRDRWGESFEFVVNGRAIFAKGASWIPAHSFAAGLTRADYERDLRSAAGAHMNMVRVWGGGIYESEDFYDLCDELGLLVWQDFMFACALYPADPAFRRSVRDEAHWQVRRLRHRACLALWCGNNEIDMLNADALKQSKVRRGHDAIFRGILPAVVRTEDGVTAYWPSSPSRSERPGVSDPESSGNAHFWQVWHARAPVSAYRSRRFRFVGEFGMQSFPSLEVAKTFCPPGQLNVFAPVMESHQKNPAGNAIILDYISRLYRFPKDYASLAFLSHLNQAHCLQVGVEHYRRCMPRTMGALYWQLNDCWPGASWSSLEFGGGWKPLHYVARRFFAPVLLCAEPLGEETTGIGNIRRSTVDRIALHVISDRPAATSAVAEWELWHLSGKRLRRRRQSLVLRPAISRRINTLDLGADIARHGRESLYVRIVLRISGKPVSEETVLLAAPRFLALRKGKIETKLKFRSPRVAELRLSARHYVHRCWFELPGLPHRADDNAFDLHPGRTKHVRLEFTGPATVAQVKRALRVRSLVDTY